jgi:hypothetical protein
MVTMLVVACGRVLGPERGKVLLGGEGLEDLTEELRTGRDELEELVWVRSEEARSE